LLMRATHASTTTYFHDFPDRYLDYARPPETLILIQKGKASSRLYVSGILKALSE
jgi:hypothetical protein